MAESQIQNVCCTWLRTILNGRLLFVGILVWCAAYSISGPEAARAQKKWEQVDYYVSPFPSAVAIDPLGYILGRISARYEYRLDPLISRYFEIAYQRNLSRAGNGIVKPSTSIAYGERIYLRDNAAMIGLYAGAGLGLAIIDQSQLSGRLTMEMGYKLTLGSKSHFFIEPELMVDAYFIHHANVSLIFPYVAIPLGYAW